MTHTYSVSGMTCGGCAATVQRTLSAIKQVKEAKIDVATGTAIITMSEHIPLVRLQESLSGYPYTLSEENGVVSTPQHASVSHVQDQFWSDMAVWKRASLNTLNCLIGCSIGDFAMVIFLQRFYPVVSMTGQMVLATLAGLITSIALETVLLKTREKFAWSSAFQTALSMSFISMVAMELVMNATDFMITGGKAAFGNPMYWTALLIAMVAGFLAPLPYNYYKLKKFNKACH
ncbi:hypothetical protein WSM22_26760 [Cytophagales bacterium WSM2-2]|nr:hypothetical protein WSM22_26760 [Cytophagales bacterium WSM2-2]